MVTGSRKLFVLILFGLSVVSAELTARKALGLGHQRGLKCSTQNFCSGKADGNYVDPCDQTKFIQCSGGITYVTSCQTGLVYDSSCDCCNYPSSTPSNPTPTPSPPKSPPTPTPTPPTPTHAPPPPSPTPSPTPSPSPSSPSGTIKAAYWGQGAAASTLADVCGRYDIVFLSFLPDFGNGQDVTASSAINIAGHSLTQTATDIHTCQSSGKKIVLSMGGAVGNYGFTSTSDAQSTATAIWNAYLGGSGTNRPFGASVILDGIDLDIEQSNGEQYYSAFVTALKGLYAKGSKKYLLTAVPQCPFPDANLGPKTGTALGDTGSSFDYVSIQFYNTPFCGGSNTVSGYGPWNTWASSTGVKLLPTFPAASNDAGSGYQAASAVAAELNQLKSDSTYGGWNLFTAEDDNGFSSQLPS